MRQTKILPSICQCCLFLQLLNLLTDCNWAQDAEFLRQNWTPEQRQFFYTTTQGSRLLPYDWFIALERADSNDPFVGDNLLKLGFVKNAKSRTNPDALPVGFVIDVDSIGGRHFGLTCAACHTNQIQFGNKRLQIDGGPSLADTWGLLKGIGDSLNATKAKQDKWDRFVTKILGQSPKSTDVDALTVKYNSFLDYYNNFIKSSESRHPWGRGRLDAFGMIFNRVSSIDLDLPENSSPPNAPVSYPFLWGTSWENVVQWNGAIPNTSDIDRLGRNIGEVLGVFGQADLKTLPIFRTAMYRSSANRLNLIRLENHLKQLWSPKWPSDLAPLNEDLVRKGKILFDRNCVRCHKVIPHGEQSTQVTVELTRISEIQTDPLMAKNAATRMAKTGRIEGAKVPGLPPLQANIATGGLLQNVVRGTLLSPFRDVDQTGFSLEMLQTGPLEIGNFVSSQTFSKEEIAMFLSEIQLTAPEAQELIASFEAKVKKYLDDLQVSSNRTPSSSIVPTDDDARQALDRLMVYKGRPLDGIWATAPYLHNGSVPNLYEILLPRDKRSKTFHIGNVEYDPVHVGFKTDEVPGTTTLVDTQLEGNSNSGHDMYGVFEEHERWELVEYMKSL